MGHTGVLDGAVEVEVAAEVAATAEELIAVAAGAATYEVAGMPNLR